MSESETVRVFTAGFNNPGYLPDGDIPAFSSFDDAKAYLIAEMLNVADHCTPTEPEEEAYAEQLTAAAEDLNLVSGPDWGTIIDYSDRRREAWWIETALLPADDAREALGTSETDPVLTVGALRDLLANLPADTQVIVANDVWYDNIGEVRLPDDEISTVTLCRGEEFSATQI